MKVLGVFGRKSACLTRSGFTIKFIGICEQYVMLALVTVLRFKRRNRVLCGLHYSLWRLRMTRFMTNFLQDELEKFRFMGHPNPQFVDARSEKKGQLMILHLVSFFPSTSNMAYCD
mmetsp:Transcript_2246/g.8285  ORF Transcript_2246/g.8285 Transcript_2246/m.8285 type:complete len:116 (-) Transcript_2246:111-458(-)